MFQSYDIEARRKGKMKGDDRIFVLKPMEGKKVLSSTGAVDPRLFNGENNLHAILDHHTGMWKLKYEQGGLPVNLQMSFTLFSEVEDFVRKYWKNRNIEVVEIKE